MINVTLQDVSLKFEVSTGLFSPRQIDGGTLAMLSCVRFSANDKILDLGCGYGPVGILAAKLINPKQVFLLDADQLAVECAIRNAQLNDIQGLTVKLSDGFRDFSEAGFTQILSNPPYHADFAVPKHFIHKGFNRLVVGGTMWMVTKRQTWYRNKLRSVFGTVQEHSMGQYIVFQATKRSANYAT